MFYIKELNQQIHDYLIQEIVNPERCVPVLRNDDPKAWNNAWRVWEEWMDSHWRSVARAHAGEEVTDSEFYSRYGLWKDRESEPGHLFYA